MAGTELILFAVLRGMMLFLTGVIVDILDEQDSCDGVCCKTGVVLIDDCDILETGDKPLVVGCPTTTGEGGIIGL